MIIRYLRNVINHYNIIESIKIYKMLHQCCTKICRLHFFDISLHSDINKYNYGNNK